MSIAAAVRLTSENETDVIRRAAAMARSQGEPCFTISIVDELPYGAMRDGDWPVVSRNLAVIAEEEASPVVQEAEDIPSGILDACRLFGVSTLLLRSGFSNGRARSVAEQVLYLDPPFDIVVVATRYDPGTS